MSGSTPSAPWSRRERATAALVFLAGVVLRIVFLVHVKGEYLFQRPLLDAEYYHRWALEIAAGDWLGASRGLFMMSPGYSYLLAVVYTLFGTTATVVAVVQMLLGVACAWMIFRIGAVHFSRETGLIAAALSLLYAPGIFYESVLLKATLVNALNVGALLAVSAGHPAGWLLSGLLAGFSAHLRPTALLLVPVLLLWLWRRSPRRILAVSLLAGGVLLALVPVALRNKLVGGEWVWTTAHGGMNFYTGNSPGTRGPYTSPPFARTDAAFEQGDFLREASRRSGAALTPAQSSRYWYAETWRVIRQDPRRAAGLILNKTLIFFNRYEPSINADYESYRREFGSVLSLPLVSLAALLPLALLGLARARPNALLLGYLAVVLVGNVVFFVTSEYRFPAVPVLCVYAGWGVCRLLADIRARASRRLALSAAALLLLVWAVSFDLYGTLLGMPDYERVNGARSAYNLGWVYQEAGRSEAAITAYRDAVRLDPAFAEPHNNLGVLLSGQGRELEAVAEFEKVLALRQGVPEAHRNLGALLARLGRRQEAQQHLQEAQRLEQLRDGPR